MAAGGTTSFQVRFTPGAVGTRSATLSVGNNDANENPYDFALRGTGVTPGSGSISREVWSGVGGTSVANIPVAAAPNITDTLPSFEAPTNWADDYGTRLRGYLTAPTTGSYTFWIASDDNSELWLSTNDNPANKVRIASVPDWTDSRQWNKLPSQKSAAITLTAGQRYYVEALHKEGGGGDNLAVGWAKPGEPTTAPSEVIPGSALSPFSGGGQTAAPEINVLGNGTTIIDGDTTPSGTDHTDFGNADFPNGTVTRTFTIQNLGTDVLTVNPVTLSGANATDFSVITQPASTVAAGGTTSFQVRFTPGAVGTRTATLSVGNNDANENPYDFALLGTGVSAAPEINVLGNGTAIIDGDTTPSGTDHTDFGSTDFPNGTVTRTFTIQNLGTASLTLNAVTFSGVHAADFSVITQPASTVAAGGTTSLQVRFTPGAVGTRTATLSVGNNDTDENPYNFALQGTGVTSGPEINVLGNGTAISDGDTTPSGTDHTDFGSTDFPNGTVTRTFTIQNLGTASLTLNAVTFSGVHAADFSVITQPASTVAAGGTTSFQVRFTPGAVGTRTATLSVGNNDANENPYDFALQGTGVTAGSGSISREVWSGIGGTSVANIPVGAAPNLTDTLSNFEAPTNWADDYGTRLRGYITAPATGSYTFWIASDDNSELWLSANDNPANKVSIASVPDWTDSRQWNKLPSQKSAAITLTAGQRYYVEALQKEAGGGDNLAVGWAKPGEPTTAPSEVIPGSVLSPFSGGGQTAAPEINFLGNGTAIIDGDTTPSGTDHTDFGNTDFPNGTVTRTFTIQNLGTASLTLNSVTLSGVHAADFSVITQPASTVAAGGTTSFQVRFTPGAVGTRTATLSVGNNDTDENPYNFALQGTGVTSEPEINVLGNGTTIIDGNTTPSGTDHTDFGNTDFPNGTATRTFTIQNLGTASLTLNAVTFSGVHAADFSVITQPASTVAAGGTTSLQVRFTPGAVGTRTATVSVGNNDTDENPYNFALQGTGVTSEPEINVLGNGTAISDGDTTPSGTDHTDFGNTDFPNGTVTRTFTIQNLGTASLTVNSVTLSGVHAADFSVITQPASTVAAGGTTSFQVRFTPGAVGTRTATLSVGNNDANENPYNFALQGTGVTSEPEINVLGNGTAISDGDTTPSGTDHTDFGNTDFPNGTATRTFTIQNLGTASLTLNAVTFSGVHAADFSVITQPASTVAAGGTTSLQVRFTPGAVGTRTATLSVGNNDTDENPYDFALQGTGVTSGPEINVLGNGTAISDGDTTPSGTDHTDFGSTDVTNGTVTRTFTIQNLGTASLTLNAVTFSGVHAADFSVITQPASTVAAGGTTSFQVRFDPSAVGTRSATLSVGNNDANENPYDFALQGTGVTAGFGSISREVWTGISGTSVANIPVGAAPNLTDTLANFEAPTNWANNYGTRLRGYITAPVTGSYTFWIASDENSELWLSTNDNPANKARIAWVVDRTNSRQWNKLASQKSLAIPLTAGQRYYVEALQKESNGGDNLAVGWAKPGQSTSAPSEVIPGSVLSPFSGGGQ